jgi:hypothetical protein
MTKGTTKKLLTAEALVPVINKALSTNYNVRSITTLRQAKKIPYTRLGYRTLRYDVDKVLHALTRNEVKAMEPWG